MAEAKKLKIIQKRSVIGQIEPHKRTIKALGLGRPHWSVIHKDTPQIRGMIERIKHLVFVEEVRGKSKKEVQKT